MGKYEVGVLGNFDGKIGTVVGARWKGIEYMRSKGRKSKKPPTLAQLDHRAKFGTVARFVHKIGKLLMTVYPQTDQLTAINQAFADIYDKAIIGAYPAYDLDYSKISVSKGDLINGNGPAAAAAGNGLLKFSWTDNTDGNMANATDKCIMLAYCPELQQSMFKISGAERSAAADTLNMMNYTGKTVHTWLSFRSADGNNVATSIYTGAIIVT